MLCLRHSTGYQHAAQSLSRRLPTPRLTSRVFRNLSIPGRPGANADSLRPLCPVGKPARRLCSAVAQSVSQPSVDPAASHDCLLSKYILGGGKWTSIAHEYWRHLLRPGDTVIDATCGRGRDTVTMARMVQAWESSDGTPPGRVFALDIQQEAVEATKALLKAELEGGPGRDSTAVQVLCQSHCELDTLVPERSVRLVSFNLGFLPGSDRTVITEAEGTLKALQACTRAIGSGGVVSVVAYLGHKGGMEEYETVCGFARSLDASEWTCCEQQWLNIRSSPRLILISRKK